MPKALVAVHDHDLSFMCKLKLERAGFEVRAAGNSEQVLEAAEEFRPDIVLVDIAIPGGGVDLLAQLRQHDWAADMRAVALFNISRSEVPSSIRFLSVDRLVAKTYNTPAQIAEIVQEVMKENGA